MRFVVPLIAVIGSAGVLAPSASAIGTPVVIDGFGSSTAAPSPFKETVTALPLPNTSTTPQGTFSAGNGLATMTMSGDGNGTAGTQLDYTPTSGGSVDMTGGGNNTQVLVSFALVNQIPVQGQFATGVNVFMSATDSSGGTAIEPIDAVGNYFAFNAAFPFTGPGGFQCTNDTCRVNEGGNLDFTHITHFSITFEYPAQGTGGGSLTVEVNELWATPTGGAPPSAPSPTVTAPVPAVAPAGGTVDFTVSFTDDQGDAPVTYHPPSNTGLRASDLTVSGTAFGAATPTVAVTGGPSTYTVAVGGMTQNGTITVDVPAGVVDDAWGQLNLASSNDPTAAFTFAVPPRITSGNQATFAELTNGSFTVQTTGNPAAALSMQQGIPSGLNFTDNGDGTATISGAPDLNQVGTDTVTLQATNLAGTATQQLTITINRTSQSPLTLTSTTGTFGTGLTLATSGGSGTGDVSYAAVKGTASGCSVTAGVLSVSGAGTCRVTATKAQDANYNSASSPQTTVTFAKADQTPLTLTPTSGTFGTGLTLTTSGGSGTGGVSYAAVDGTASGCSVSTGVLSVSSAGTCLVTATNAGDANYNSASSPQTTVTFGQADQTPLALTSTSGTFGTGLTLTTTGGSGTGDLSYAAVDGTASGCAVTADVLTVSGTGTCLVTATKAGDGNYDPASSPQTTVTFGQADQTPLILTSTSGTFGTGLTLTTTGGSGTGDVSYAAADGTASGCSVTAGVLSVSSAGSCLVTATKAGDANYNAVSSPQTTVTFGQADQTPLILTSTSGTFGTGLTLTTTGGSGTGDVSYLALDGTASGCSVTAGVLSVSSTGTCLVTATKAADSDYNAVSSPSTTVSIAKAPQTITFSSQPPAHPQVGGAYTAVATADSGLPVAFSIDPASGTGVCSIAGADVSFAAAGVCIIDANQGGNGNYLASAPSQQTLTVTVPVATQQTGPGGVPVTGPVVNPQTGTGSSTPVSILPPNHFVDPPRYKARSNGSFTVSVKVPGPGRIDVMITAWKGNLVHGALDAKLFKLLQPAPGRFVFARARSSATRAGTVQMQVTPNAEGLRLLARQRPETLVRVWVTFTPLKGRSHSVGYYGVLLG
ncbi:MAG TPA: hypothetical protein VMB27_21610 [Solirubrobacteraceae bacterium]|nr:hypothetical protein [Solirubrobacteraceae bacterium]